MVTSVEQSILLKPHLPFQHTTERAYYSVGGNILEQSFSKFEIRPFESEHNCNLVFECNAPSADEIQAMLLPKTIEVGEATHSFYNYFDRDSKMYRVGYTDCPDLKIFKKERHDINDFYQLALRVAEKNTVSVW